jgi:hypothetical protein
MKKLKKCHENFIRSNFSKGLNYLLNRGVKKFCKMKKIQKWTSELLMVLVEDCESRRYLALALSKRSKSTNGTTPSRLFSKFLVKKQR